MSLICVARRTGPMAPGARATIGGPQNVGRGELAVVGLTDSEEQAVRRRRDPSLVHNDTTHARIPVTANFC